MDVTAGQQHESTVFEEVANAVCVPRPEGRPRCRPLAMAGDKAYSQPRIRAWLAEHRIEDVIPTRSDQARRPSFDRSKYRCRNVVERCISWLKEARRIATRFEKLAVNFLAMIKLAMLNRYLRLF